MLTSVAPRSAMQRERAKVACGGEVECANRITLKAVISVVPAVRVLRWREVMGTGQDRQKEEDKID